MGPRQNFCELIYLAERRVRQTTKGRLTDRQVGRYRTRQTGRQIENCLSYLRWCSLATPQAQAQSPAITKSMHNATCLWVFVHSHSQNNKTNYTRPAFPSLTIWAVTDMNGFICSKQLVSLAPGGQKRAWPWLSAKIPNMGGGGGGNCHCSLYSALSAITGKLFHAKQILYQWYTIFSSKPILPSDPQSGPLTIRAPRQTQMLIITGHSDSCYYQMGAGKYEHKPTSGVCGRVSGFSTLVKPASSSVDPVNVLTMSLSGSFTCTKWEGRVKLMDQHAMGRGICGTLSHGNQRL